MAKVQQIADQIQQILDNTRELSRDEYRELLDLIGSDVDTRLDGLDEDDTIEE